jgi:hypothetical protein
VDTARLAHAHAVLQQAGSGVQSADQRLTAAGAIAALAASMSLAGATLILDYQKLASPPAIRAWFGGFLVAALICFTLTGVISTFGHHTGAKVRKSNTLRAELGAKDIGTIVAAVEERCTATRKLAQHKHVWATLALVLLCLGMLAIVALAITAMFTQVIKVA